MAGLTQGFNISEINVLKEQIEAAFEALAAKTDILFGIEEVVFKTWKGPDAEKFLDNLFNKYNDDLVPKVKLAYQAMNDELDRVKKAWEDFQESN